MKKLIHAVCKSCYKIYKNYALLEAKSKAENTRLFTCVNCIIKSCENNENRNLRLW